MTRRCSHCNNNGHNSRTCPTTRGGATTGGVGGSSGSGGASGGVRLFGVRLTDGSIMKKSASMGNLSSLHSYHSSSSPNPPGSPSSDVPHLPDGYLSDDPNTHASISANRRLERKKGVPWTEEEHRLFLLGLQKLGKGDWRGISRNFVTSRTPTQVASHAQKYFIRQSNATRRKRRSSLFDIVADTGTDASHPLPEEQFMLPPRAVESDKEHLAPSATKAIETDFADSLPSLDLSLKSDFESMETTPTEPVEGTKPNTSTNEIPSVYPAFFPAYIPVPYSFWPSNAVPVPEDRGAEPSHHQILKPIPTVPKEPVNVDELVGMSQLTLADAGSGHIEPSPLSLKLTAEPSRQSAFHASTPVKSSEITKGETAPIQAV
ncbi:transcription factor MYBS3 [Nicotiana tabacum]|uniref:Transcription factor MYB1R1 n=1 Tax=Nicotiana tabacum TaxID=4097 RepID=A0A1S3Y675_TOBAC|nr:PREDICTED: transcription factor MYB1R1-like [Nicotiana tabacum]